MGTLTPAKPQRTSLTVALLTRTGGGDEVDRGQKLATAPCSREQHQMRRGP